MRRNVGPRSKKIVESTAAITTETRCESHPALGRIPSTKKGSPRRDSLKNLGWEEGLEPSASNTTNWRSNQLSYTHHRFLIQ